MEKIISALFEKNVERPFPSKLSIRKLEGRQTQLYLECVTNVLPVKKLKERYSTKTQKELRARAREEYTKLLKEAVAGVTSRETQFVAASAVWHPESQEKDTWDKIVIQAMVSQTLPTEEYHKIAFALRGACTKHGITIKKIEE